VSVDFSSNPDQVIELLKSVAMEIRNSDEFRDVFIADPQVLGVDSVKGSELIFPVVFKTRPLKQHGPVREFRRRVRIALEENHLLPGDPLRVYNAGQSADARPPIARAAAVTTDRDPTTIKPQESNPFSGGS
jgi:small conductance mechanosensitive channel